MKKILLLLLFVFSMTAYSCEEIPVVDPDDPNENTDPSDKDKTGPQPGTYKFVASPQKGKWYPRDQVYVHGKLGAYAEVVTLTDISADGKTATAQLADVTTSLVGPDGLYAAWPDEAVRHAKGVLGSKINFKTCDRMLTAAYLVGDTFTFIDASSSLAFTVEGDFDKYALAANNRDGLAVTDFEVEYTSKKCEFNQKQNSGYPFLYGDIVSGKQVNIWFPAEMAFNKGLTIYLGKGTRWTAIYKLSGDVVLETAKCKDLGNITSDVEPYRGPAPTMPVMGASTKYAVDFNELSGICLSENRDFLWGVGDDGSIARLSFEGKVLEEHWIGCDLEAVTRNPETGDLIVSIEDLYNPKGSGEKIYSYNGIGRISAPEFKSVTGLFRINAVKSYDNAGVEGVTMYNDGLILAGSQANSHLFCINLQTGEILWDKKLYNEHLISEIADLCYDPLSGWLWIMDSEAKKVFVLSMEKLLASNAATDQEAVYDALLGAYPVSEPANPESVCVDYDNACIWVGDDYGSTSYLYRYEMTGLEDYIIIE